MIVSGEIQVVPVGTEVSLTKYIAECKKVFDRSGYLKYEMHDMGTNFVGDYDLVMKIGKQCIEAVMDKGAPRVVCTPSRLAPVKTRMLRISLLLPKRLRCLLIVSRNNRLGYHHLYY